MFSFKLLIKLLLSISPFILLPFGYKYLYANKPMANADNPMEMVQKLLGGSMGAMSTNNTPSQSQPMKDLKKMIPDAVKPILKPDEAKDDAISPKDNPSDWDYIENVSQKCWFHKRTRKKVCEAKN